MTTILASAHTATTISLGHLMGETVLWLCVIVAALFGLKYLSKHRKAPNRRLGRTLPGNLVIETRQSIGKGQWIAIVQADGKRFLVGISSAGFTRVGELDADTAGDRIGTLAKVETTTAPPEPKRSSLLARAKEATVRR